MKPKRDVFGLTEMHGPIELRCCAWVLLTGLLICVCLTGCAGLPVTTIRQTAPGEIDIRSGKNVSISGLDYTAPDGSRLKVKSYQSANDPAAIKAAGERERVNIAAGGAAAGNVIGAAASAAAKGGL